MSTTYKIKKINHKNWINVWTLSLRMVPLDKNIMATYES